MAKNFFTIGRIGAKRRQSGSGDGGFDLNPTPGANDYGHWIGRRGGDNGVLATGGGHGGSSGGGYAAASMPGEDDTAPQNGESAPESGGASGSGGNGGNSGYDGHGESGGAANGSGGSGYAAGSFEDYYSRLIAALHNYGISMELPTLDELYEQLSSFLRPSVDAAIENRRKYGETTLAELDADAYSRGMGSSSYLSSMKNREYDDIANDVTSLERNYSSTLAEYLYNASNELAKIQAQFAQMAREHEYEMQRQRQQQEYEMQRQLQQQQHEMEKLRRQQEFERAMKAAAAAASGNGGSGKSGSGNGKGGGASGGGSGKSGVKVQKGGSNTKGQTDGPDETSYYNYSVFMNSISEQDRYNAFNSSSAYWTKIRSELKSSLTPQQYERLRAAFDPSYGSNPHGGGSGHNPIRDRNVNTFD